MEPELKVEFLILGEIPPEEITKVIGVPPTETWLKGDSILGTPRLQKKNGWVLAPKIDEKSIDLEDYLQPLLDLLVPRAEEIAKLCDDHNLFSQICCGIDIVDDAPVIDFSRETMAKIAQLKTTLDIDIVLTE